MASLRNIMNVDDDHVDSHSLKKSKESAPRSHHHPASSASASSYANPADLSVANSSSSSGIAARGHSSNPPAHGLSSLDVDTASSSSFGLSHTTANYSQDRRQSNTSTDSMDSPYGQGHGHGHPGGSYSGTPMRPFVPGAEAPVKLTPITGRVSRAKKGLAVHTCETCRPPKTFTRAEHLRRHQLSHQPPELSCQVPGCDKVFHRKDLLDRHLQKHDQDNRTAKSTPRQSSTARSFGSRSPRHGSYGPSPPGSMLSMGHPFSSPPPGATSAANTSSQGVHMMPGHWASTGGSTAHIRSASDNFSLMDSVPGLQSASSKASGFSQARPPTGLGVMDVPELNLQDVGSANVPWQDSSGVVTSSSGSSYSTPPSEVSRAPATVRAPSAEWTAPLGPPVASRTLQSPVAVSGAYPAPFGYDSSPPAVYPSVYGDGAGVLLPGYDESLYNPQIPSNTVRNSLSPQLAVGPSSETLVTAPAALAPDRVISPMLCGRQPDTAFGFLMAGDLIHVPLSREARNEIPVYIDKYWEKVHPLYPIIHRPSFEDASGVDSQHHDILRCAMAAVATQFLEHKEHRINGSQLHAHALHECKRIPQSNWSLSIMQALLLCEHYAQFRGRSKEAYLPSAQFNALCQMVANSQFALDSVTLGCDNFQRWRSWTHLESCRRILSACFLLSVHGIWYYEQPVTSFLGLDNFSPMMLSIPLSAGTKKAWEAETADSWASIDFSTVKSRTVGDAMQEQLSPAMIESMPRFDSSLLLAAHALQLPRRRNPTEVDIFQDASCIKPHDMVIPTLFQHSPGGYTYLALHYTPLQCLLSVSGDSWILNNKVSHPSIFIDHKMKLQKWRRSGNAAAATVFAAKALRIFLNLGPNAFGHNDVLLAGQKRSLPSWTDISDFWGVYVCALICWAFGYEGKRNPSKSSRGAAVGWLLTVSELEPGDLQNLTGREESQGVVGLIHDVLGRDCLGGRNILYADAVRVLRKLEEVDNWAWI